MPVTLNGTNGVTFNDGSSQATAARDFGFKNRIINGDMRIDQRNNGASVTPVSVEYQIDRWRYLGANNRVTVQRSSVAPTGFTNSMLVTSTSSYTPTGSDAFLYQQFIEGFNCSDFAWGTASALTVTLSFWVRSSLTGTFSGTLSNAGRDRSYPYTYTINSANTWEYKTVTIPGPTNGTWNTDNTRGVAVEFSLGAVSSYLGTPGSWANTDFRGATGQVNFTATNGATWQVTGVQLEKGSTATSFDYRPYGTELALCQRYCYKQTPSTSNEVGIGPKQGNEYIKWSVTLPVTMRAAPTWTNAPTSYVSSLSASGQVTAYNFNAAATYTINGSLSVINQLNVNGGGLYILASIGFSGSAGDFSGVAMFDSPIYSAEL